MQNPAVWRGFRILCFGVARAARRGRRGDAQPDVSASCSHHPSAGHPWPALDIPPASTPGTTVVAVGKEQPGGASGLPCIPAGRCFGKRGAQQPSAQPPPAPAPVLWLSPLTSAPKPDNSVARRVSGGCAESRQWMAGARPWEQDADRTAQHTPRARAAPARAPGEARSSRCSCSCSYCRRSKKRQRGTAPLRDLSTPRRTPKRRCSSAAPPRRAGCPPRSGGSASRCAPGPSPHPCSR